MTRRNHFPLLLIIIFILLASALSDAAAINAENALPKTQVSPHTFTAQDIKE